MTDLVDEIRAPDRILAGLAGLDQKAAQAGWNDVFTGALAELRQAHRDLTNEIIKLQEQ